MHAKDKRQGFGLEIRRSPWDLPARLRSAGTDGESRPTGWWDVARHKLGTVFLHGLRRAPSTRPRRCIFYALPFARTKSLG